MTAPSRADAPARTRTFSGSKTVTWIDKQSARRIIWYGDGFLNERLPVGTRVIYPPSPLKGLPDPDRAIRQAPVSPDGGDPPPLKGLPAPARPIRQALVSPDGGDPLHARLRPGMRVTVAIDDISVPLPQMVRPDARERVLNILVPLLHDHGIDDIHIIVATCFHRRMTPHEIRRAVGERVFKEFWPDRLYNHDGEDAANMVSLGKTRHGEEVTINRRAAESDLVVYVNINLVPMDGGHKSVGVGLCGYKTLQAHHTPEAILGSDSYMDPDHSDLHHSVNRIGRVVDRRLPVFHVETALNNRMYGETLSFLGKNEDTFTDLDRAKFAATQATLSRLPGAMRRGFLQRVPSPYEIIAVHAGTTEEAHKPILDACHRQYAVDVRGQADVLIMGIPFISPYNVNSTLNPLLVQVLALGYLHNLYRGRPLLKKGGTLIVCHPLHDDFNAEHHPSYVEFFHRLLPETRDSFELRERYEERFATDPGYLAMYRRGHAYHGVHPFYMWYWGENGRKHVGRVIAAGCQQPYVAERMGWEWSSTLTEALDMARESHGADPEITMLHFPPLGLCDVSTAEGRLSTAEGRLIP